MDDLTLLPEIMHKQPERAQDEAAALAAVSKLKAPLEALMQAFLEELKSK